MNTLILGFVELAKISLQAYFLYMRISGGTDEEAEVLYKAEKAKFIARNPTSLPDPPPDN